MAQEGNRYDLGVTGSGAQSRVSDSDLNSILGGQRDLLAGERYQLAANDTGTMSDAGRGLINRNETGPHTDSTTAFRNQDGEWELAPVSVSASRNDSSPSGAYDAQGNPLSIERYLSHSGPIFDAQGNSLGQLGGAPLEIEIRGSAATESDTATSFMRGYNGEYRSVMEGEAPLAETVGRYAGAAVDSFKNFGDAMTGAGSMRNAMASWRRGDYGLSLVQGATSFAEAGSTVFSFGTAGAIRSAGTVTLRTEAEVVVANTGDKQYGVAFFGESNLGYYTRETATIGREGKSFFFMPVEDSAVVKNAADAARYTGRAPSAEAAYLQGGDVYGLSFPTDGMKISRPTAADAGGWPHFLEGGNTAVRLGDGPGAGYLVNSTREFVIPGGSTVPSGSALFKLGPNGEWIPIRKF